MGIGKIGLWSSHGATSASSATWPPSTRAATVAGYSDLERYIEVMMAAGRRTGLHAPETDVHAGGLETSMMLAAYPDLVRPFDEVEGYTAAEPGWLQRIFEEGIRPVSESGVLGDVAGANPRSAKPSSPPSRTNSSTIHPRARPVRVCNARTSRH